MHAFTICPKCAKERRGDPLKLGNQPYFACGRCGTMFPIKDEAPLAEKREEIYEKQKLLRKSARKKLFIYYFKTISHWDNKETIYTIKTRGNFPVKEIEVSQTG